jgi:hypothetical protein
MRVFPCNITSRAGYFAPDRTNVHAAPTSAIAYWEKTVMAQTCGSAIK